MKKDELRYLQRLAEIYPTIGKASTEIINLQSILNLPKGTEHFMSDLHGEYQAFSHVLRNGSGAVRKKIDDVFGHTLSNNDKRSLATLIYYPKEKMDLVKDTEEDMENWYKITLYRLIEICKTTASKYTRSKVRKALPTDYAYVIEELITEKAEVLDKEAYYDSIVNTIIEIGSAENFIIALAELIQRLVVVFFDLFCRFSRRQAFQSCPHMIDVFHIFPGDADYFGTTVWCDLHQTFQIQLPQGFPHRCPADSQLFPQGCFFQFFTGSVVSG